MHHTVTLLHRQELIETAYAVLAENGYAATSLAAVARRANVTEETLRGWFGSKSGLFQAMVEDNARAGARILEAHLDGNSTPSQALRDLGPALLRLVTGERAVALNRAAAVDASDSGALGRTIAQSGREHIVPLLWHLFAKAHEAGHWHCPVPGEAAEF
ncbi:TetR/AcrR family transcriptional regulator [Roseospirillum parvum]|uniref:Regulatory protein, tetR family n=1 Tax=Roseospirillum parvum TaxID=83401 RepID=A0A1G8AQK0_9PROT|nr:TetR/AcrR family transcriptional regulator [Roseospirillum parvum]SDH23245.1 regulatory protein, tetR family [Roseospirillum parvum]